MKTEFKINQLRQDKIIYAIEAVAVNITCLVGYLLLSMVSNFFPNNGLEFYYASMATLAIALIYTFYALIGNLNRLKRIKKLESEL